MHRLYENLYRIGYLDCTYSSDNEDMPEKIDEEYVKQLHEICVKEIKDFEEWNLSTIRPWRAPSPPPFYQSFETQFENENPSVDMLELETGYDFTRIRESYSEVEDIGDKENSNHVQKSPQSFLQSENRSFSHSIDPDFEDYEEELLLLDDPENVEKQILQLCEQNVCLPFSILFPSNYLDHCHKIGEGSYSEVFQYSKNGEISVIKIIPVGGTILYNSSPQGKLSDILSEMIISKFCDELRVDSIFQTSGFINLKHMKFFFGKYPNQLVEECEKYAARMESVNDPVTIFEEDQMYIALEFAHGGLPLDQFGFDDASQTYSAFTQIALTLAVAERAFEFEHRDLHIGNVLVSKTTECEVNFKLGDLTFRCPTQGIKTSIIDFTHSRMNYKKHAVIGRLGQNSSIFEGVNNYQFDVYRYMKAEVNDDWERYTPHSNILWLNYILKEMLRRNGEINYRYDDSDLHKRSLSQLKVLQKGILNYESAFDFVTSSNETNRLKFLSNPE